MTWPAEPMPAGTRHLSAEWLVARYDIPPEVAKRLHAVENVAAYVAAGD